MMKGRQLSTAVKNISVGLNTGPASYSLCDNDKFLNLQLLHDGVIMDYMSNSCRMLSTVPRPW